MTATEHPSADTAVRIDLNEMASNLTIRAQSAPLLTITTDGHVVPGEGLVMDETAAAFLRACSEYVANLQAARDAADRLAQAERTRAEALAVALEAERQRADAATARAAVAELAIEELAEAALGWETMAPDRVTEAARAALAAWRALGREGRAHE